MVGLFELILFIVLLGFLLRLTVRLVCRLLASVFNITVSIITSRFVFWSLFIIMLLIAYFK